MMALLLANTTTAQTAPPAEKPGKPLSPEAEMAIMRVMNLENRIQTLQTVPVKMTDNELAGHFSGTWICWDGASWKSDSNKTGMNSLERVDNSNTLSIRPRPSAPLAQDRRR
jgi:hypothetical protein